MTRPSSDAAAPGAARPPAVAGAFYPADADALAAIVDAALGSAPDAGGAPKAIIAPHAGYRFCARALGAAFRPLLRLRRRVKRVVVLSPAHTVALKGAALPSVDSFENPLGALDIDAPRRRALLALPGVAVDDAAHAGEHGVEVLLPFLQRALGAPRILPVLVGEMADADRAALMNALWGGPDTLIVVSSDLSHFLAETEARTCDGETARFIERLEAGQMTPERACGWSALRGFLSAARARDLRPTRRALMTSADSAGGPERVVGYGAWSFESAATAQLPETHRALLLHLARRALIEPKGFTLDLRAVPVSLGGVAASFVSLELGGRLRGCRGSLAAHRALAADVAISARQAGFEDPRFAPLTPDEARRVAIEISVLSTPLRMAVADETALMGALNPDADGLILTEAQAGGAPEKRAVFLPKVWKTLPAARDFVRALKTKGGWPAEHWSDRMRAYRFSTETFDDIALG